jgi:hypothetical protein
MSEFDSFGFDLNELVSEATEVAQTEKTKIEKKKEEDRQTRNNLKTAYHKELEAERARKQTELMSVRNNVMKYIRENWLLRSTHDSPLVSFGKLIEAEPTLRDTSIKVIFSFSKGGDKGNYYIEIQNLPQREIIYANEIERELKALKSGKEIKLI